MDTATVGIAVAFMAGLLSFLSPCVLPLIPSYATFLTGMSLSELIGEGQPRAPVRRALLIHGALFVMGFTLVFIALGASATFIGGLLFHYSVWIERIGGALLIAFGLFLLGVLRLPGANREWRLQLGNKPAGYLGTLFVGVAFGAGWTPCVGPVLGAILTIASTMDSVREGVVLLGSYSAGLAVPFVLATVALDRFLAGFRQFRRWLPWVSRLSGALLVVVGFLLMTGAFSVLAGILARWTPEFLLDRI